MSMFSSGTFWFSRRSQAPKAVCGDYTLICPIGQSRRTPLLFGEIFAGGFSGWSRGVDFLAGFGLPERVCFALDWNSDALNA